MALLLVESFEGYGTPSDATNNGWTIGGLPVIETTIVKDGGQSIRLDGSEELKQLTINTDTVMFLSVHFRFDTVPTGDTPVIIFLRESGDTSGIELIMTTASKLRIQTSSTTLADGSAVLAKDTWYHLQVKMTYSNSTSANDIIVKVDDVEDMNPVGVDSLVGSNTVSGFKLDSPTASSRDHFFDSVICWNSVAGDNWSALDKGILRIETVRPSANGNGSDWEGSDGNSVDNYLLVDDPAGLHDGDTTYVKTLTANDRDVYNYADLSNGDIGTIHAVHLTTIAKKDDVTDRRYKPLTRVASTDYLGAEVVLTNASYAFGREIWQDNPNTSSAWTESTFNGAEFGVKLTV